MPTAVNSHGQELSTFGASRSVSRQSSSYGKTTPRPGVPMLEEVLSRIEKAGQLNSNILPHSDKSGDDYFMGDMYDPPTKRDVWRLTDGKSRPYLEHVKSVSKGWPHLRWLADFMEVGTSPSKWEFLSQTDIEHRAVRTRVAMLDFSPSAPPTRLDIQSSSKLTSLLANPSFEHDPPHARLFVVEDLSRDVIEAFGAQYDIDPSFFRGHINDYLWYNTQDPWAELGEVEHVPRERTWWNFRYMRPRYFKDEAGIEQAVEQMGGFNVLRRLEQDLSYRVRKLRRSTDPPVGVLRSKTSLWIRENKEGEKGVLGMLVVDPTPSAGYPLWQGARTLHPTPKMYPSTTEESAVPPPRTSHFEDVIHYTTHLPPPAPSGPPCTSNFFDPRSQIKDLHALLSVPILTIVAAEWITVLTYVTTSLITLEYALEHPVYRLTTSGLDFALDRLHPLRRLMPVYRAMLSEVLTSILHQPPTEATTTSSSLHSEMLKLRSDFTAILERLDRLETRSSNIITLATALISVEENKRAMKMNTNLVRVTYLAVVFVPMAFVSSFFSMTPDLSLLGQTFWIYFVVAVPLTALCLAIADPRRVRKAFWWCIGRSIRSEEYVNRGIRSRQHRVLVEPVLHSADLDSIA